MNRSDLHKVTKRHSILKLADARMRRLVRHVGVTASLFAGVACAAPALAETLFLRNFSLIDGRGGAARPSSSMVVTDGRIIWVGPQREARPPADAQTVDLTGKYVIPGLVDLHIHLGNLHELTQNERFYTRANVEHDLATYASYGFTTVAIMGTDKDVIFEVRREQRAGRPTQARVYTAGQGIAFKGGYGGVPGINRPVATAQEAEVEVNAQAAKGADFIKLWMDDELGTMPKMPPEISQAIIDTAHRHGLPAFAHIFYLEDAKRLVSQGIDGLVHGVRDQRVDQELLSEMKRRGTTQVAATLSREASLFAYGKPAPQLSDPFFQQSIPPETLSQLASPERQRRVSSNPVFPRLPSFFQAASSNLKRLADAGVDYGFGTDAGPPGRVPGYSGHWELELMVGAGFTPLQAIHAATGKAAAILGARDIGTLERAKWADFVVLDANPVADIKNSRKINAVYIAGRRVPSVKP